MRNATSQHAADLLERGGIVVQRLGVQRVQLDVGARGLDAGRRHQPLMIGLQAATGSANPGNNPGNADNAQSAVQRLRQVDRLRPAS